MEGMEDTSGVAVGPSSAPAPVLVTPVTSAAPPASLPTEQVIASHHMATTSSASSKVENAGMSGGGEGGGAVFTVGNAGLIGGGGAVFTTATTMTPASAGAVQPAATTAASSLGIIGSSTGLGGSSPGFGGSSPGIVPSTSGLGIGGLTKKKRGRPRKYGPDGSVLMPLNPMPISASMPPGEFTLTSPDGVMLKRGRGRPAGSVNKQQYWRPELDSLGPLLACAAGPNFTPHVINIAAGEDVTMKIISFSQQGPKAICILSANGIISNVTLRQPDSSGGTLTYEGRFELVSLSGSFMPTESCGNRGRSGGMSVSLASPDGRVVGGGVAGLLVAASPVQVVVGSFMPNCQSEVKVVKKSQPESFSISSTAGGRSIADIDESFGIIQGQRSSATPKVSDATTFGGDSWASLHSVSDTRNTADINISLSGRVTS